MQNVKESCKGFGFHNAFTNWLKAMYQKPKASVRINGTMSQAFDLRRGTRQGSLSLLIFCLSIEPLAENTTTERDRGGYKSRSGT